MTKAELEKYKNILEAKQAELTGALHREEADEAEVEWLEPAP